MGKYKIGLTISIGDYRSMNVEVSDKASLEECEKELRQFIKGKPTIVKLNKQELKDAINYED